MLCPRFSCVMSNSPSHCCTPAQAQTCRLVAPPHPVAFFHPPKKRLPPADLNMLHSDMHWTLLIESQTVQKGENWQYLFGWGVTAVLVQLILPEDIRPVKEQNGLPAA